MKKITVFVLCLSMSILSGCYDYNDVENISYVTAVSVDTADGDMYEYCFQFVNPLSEEGEVVTYSAEGKSLYEAVNKISKDMTRKVSFTHIKMVAVSQEAAQNLERAVDGFNSSRFYRPDIILSVVQGDKASDIMSNAEHELEGNAARYYDLSFSSENSLSKVLTTVKDYFFHNSCILPLISGTSIDGIAYIKNGKLTALGDSSEAICYNLLTEGTKQSVFEDSIISSNPPGIKEKRDGNALSVDYTVTVDISPLSSDTNLQDVRSILENKLNMFINKCYAEYNADVLNTERFFKKYFLTEKELDNTEWEKFSEKLSISVKVKSTEIKKGRSAVN